MSFRHLKIPDLERRGSVRVIPVDESFGAHLNPLRREVFFRELAVDTPTGIELKWQCLCCIKEYNSGVIPFDVVFQNAKHELLVRLVDYFTRLPSGGYAIVLFDRIAFSVNPDSGNQIAKFQVFAASLWPNFSHFSNDNLVFAVQNGSLNLSDDSGLIIPNAPRTEKPANTRLNTRWVSTFLTQSAILTHMDVAHKGVLRGILKEGMNLWRVDSQSGFFRSSGFSAEIHVLIVPHDRLFSGKLYWGPGSHLKFLSPPGACTDSNYFGGNLSGCADVSPSLAELSSSPMYTRGLNVVGIASFFDLLPTFALPDTKIPQTNIVKGKGVPAAPAVRWSENTISDVAKRITRFLSEDES